MTDGSDDPDFAFDDLLDDADGEADGLLPREPHRYTVIRAYQTFAEVKAALDNFNVFVCTYDTRYETDRWHARVYRYRSHVDCDHRIKSISLAGGTSQRVYQLSEGGRHMEVKTSVARRVVHPVLRDNVDAHLQMGWGHASLKLASAQVLDEPSDARPDTNCKATGEPQSIHHAERPGGLGPQKLHYIQRLGQCEDMHNQ